MKTQNIIKPLVNFDDISSLFNISIESELSHLTAYDNMAICLLDISNFKTYNYMFGYKKSNKILELVFNKVRECIGDLGNVYRFAGDVLLITLFEIYVKSEVVNIVEKIVNLFCEPIRIENQKIRISVNLGISLYPNDSSDIETVIKYGEIALNNIKRSYTYSYSFFEAKMFESIIKQCKFDADILNAIHNNEFILQYQPQVDINDMKIYGVESLVRWNHPEYGLLQPSNFIDIVEKNGMINEIGKLIIKMACEELKKFNDLGYRDLRMSINVSEKQLEDTLFLNFIDNTIIKTGVEPRCIIIEITERILLNPNDTLIHTLTTLKSKGIKLFIDDFGTKYSSLNYLYQFNIDGIKLDKAFIDRIQCSEKDLIITKNIIKLANEINLEVVAEGVEKIEQLQQLSAINCTKIQGYIFGKPTNSKKIFKYLKIFNR